MLSIVIGIYVIAVSLISLLWQSPVILALCFISISLLMLLKWHAKSDLLLYFLAFTLGPIAEMILVYIGVWKYAEPVFFIPIWLPFAWGIAMLIIKKLSEALVEKE